VARIYRWSSNRWVPVRGFSYDEGTYGSPVPAPTGFAAVRAGFPPCFLFQGACTSAGVCELRVLRGEDDGTLSPLSILTSNALKGSASLALTSQGQPVVAYSEPDFFGGDPTLMVRRWLGSAWDEVGAGFRGWGPALRVTAADELVLVFAQDSSNSVQAKWFDGSTWTHLPSPPIPEYWDRRGVIAAELDRQNRLVVLFEDFGVDPTGGHQVSASRLVLPETWENPADVAGRLKKTESFAVGLPGIAFAADGAAFLGGSVFWENQFNTTIYKPVLVSFTHE
jgi:hypothetical protein